VSGPEGITGTEGDVPGLGEPDTSAPAVAGKNSPSAGWLKLIADAEKAYRFYQEKSDSIDKIYANLERLASTTRDREIQLFWANISVMAPSIYSRPPIPVVVPRFKSEAELPRTASELLERATGVMFDMENIDGVMRLVRDDLVLLARGAAWLRLEGTNRVCIDHADRKDFLCDNARNWKEGDWVAKRSWMTEPAAKKRFKKASGDAYKSLAYSVRKDAETDSDDGTSKAGIWELWSRSQNKVVWVSAGASVCLDEGKPHLTLEGFFPCPRPAFGTLQRRSLVPVPDMMFYKDQLEEINEITTRIAALTEAVKVRGFYASGAGEVSDAVEAAFKNTSNNTVLVPIANLSGLTGVALKDAIAWLPIEVITATITALIAVRKQLIEDVYEVTGLSDIMRGQTEASETLGAQQLKSQYGSVRIKDRQDELTRVARDITRLTGEIMAEHFDGKTLMEMAQMPLPSAEEIAAKAAPLKEQADALQKQIAHMQAEIAHAAQDPEVHAMAQQDPDKAKEVMGQVQQKLQADQQQLQALQGQLQELASTVTIDAVVELLREQKLRPFVLDIETDSTITPDENAAKQRATELTTAVGAYLKNALPLVESMPQAAPLVAETLKFVTKQYRAGRELQGVIDKFADQMKAKAEQPPPPNPEAQKAAADAAAAQAKQQQDAQTAAAKIQLEQSAQQFEQQQAAQQQQIDAQAAHDAHALAIETLRLDAQTQAAKTAETSQKHALEHEKTVAAAAEADQKHMLEWRKAELAAATSLEVARIAAADAQAAAALANQLEAQLGLAKLESAKELQAQQHAHERDQAAASQKHAETLAAAKPKEPAQ
jgi:hypothetical protein